MMLMENLLKKLPKEIVRLILNYTITYAFYFPKYDANIFEIQYFYNKIYNNINNKYNPYLIENNYDFWKIQLNYKIIVGGMKKYDTAKKAKQLFKENVSDLVQKMCDDYEYDDNKFKDGLENAMNSNNHLHVYNEFIRDRANFNKGIISATRVDIRYFIKKGCAWYVDIIINSKNFNINCLDICDCTPLFIATIYEQCEIVELLMRKGADPNIVIWEQDAIIHACFYEKTNILKLLLRHNTYNFTNCDKYNRNALMMAIFFKYQNVIEILLQYINHE